jgi:hypothetical protein
VAREHVEKLGLTNIRFVNAPALDVNRVVSEPADLVMSALLFNEIERFPNTTPYFHGWSPADWLCPPVSHSAAVHLRALRESMCESGELVSIERCPDALSLWWWTSQLALAGFEILGVEKISFSEFDRRQSIPVIRARPVESPVIPTAYDAVGWHEQSTARTLTDQVKALSRSRFPGRTIETYYLPKVLGLLDGIKPKHGVEIYYPEQNARSRIVTYRYANLVLYTHRSTLGYSELKIEPAKKAAKYEREFEEILEEEVNARRLSKSEMLV